MDLFNQTWIWSVHIAKNWYQEHCKHQRKNYLNRIKKIHADLKVLGNLSSALKKKVGQCRRPFYSTATKSQFLFISCLINTHWNSRFSGTISILYAIHVHYEQKLQTNEIYGFPAVLLVVLLHKLTSLNFLVDTIDREEFIDNEKIYWFVIILNYFLWTENAEVQHE